jgi:hypothetical protein
LADYGIRLKLPVSCPACAHGFQINPVGVQPWTDIVCPACGVVDHISQETRDRVEEELCEGLGAAFKDEDQYQAAIAFWYDAPDKARAAVVDDGF